MSKTDIAQKWANLQFAVIGQLLANPPAYGELRSALEKLAQQPWKTPTGQWRRFGISTLERWFYAARSAPQPSAALRRKTRKDAGQSKALPPALLRALEEQYRYFPRWSYQLHADNIRALVQESPELGKAPSYTTLRRAMLKRGWRKHRPARTRGEQRAQDRLEKREVRSYEMQHVHALWHLDYHQGSRKVLLADGSYHTVNCLCIIDDYSRLICHIQWYLTESAETLAHGLTQAFLKRGLPRAILSDNGSAMIAEETANATAELSINHATTLPASPYQNGKQEVFWGQLEGRLMAMLSRVHVIELGKLNIAAQAWAEQEYNRTRHSEIQTTPLQRMLDGVSLARPSPPLEDLQCHFTRAVTRRQRRSDGTITLEGVRFTIPSELRNEDHLLLRYATWDRRPRICGRPEESHAGVGMYHAPGQGGERKLDPSLGRHTTRGSDTRYSA